MDFGHLHLFNAGLCKGGGGELGGNIVLSVVLGGDRLRLALHSVENMSICHKTRLQMTLFLNYP